MRKVYIKDYFNDTKIEKKILGKSFKVICLNKKKIDLKNISDADGLLVWHADINSKVINSLKKCKVVVRYGVGYDNIDIKAASKKK